MKHSMFGKLGAIVVAVYFRILFFFFFFLNESMTEQCGLDSSHQKKRVDAVISGIQSSIVLNANSSYHSGFFYSLVSSLLESGLDNTKSVLVPTGKSKINLSPFTQDGRPSPKLLCNHKHPLL